MKYVDENIHDETLSCYDKNVLKELGSCYSELLRVLNQVGKNPYPYAEIFPTKYFTIIHNKATQIGIPEKLSERIASLLNSVDSDDWSRSMDIPVPMTKQHYFLLGLSGMVGKKYGE